MKRFVWLLVLGLAPGASAQDVPDLRQDMEVFARALDGSLRQVKRVSLGGLLGAESSRGYHLRGYGAVFILPPRLLPARGHDRLLVMPGASFSGTWSLEMDGPALPPGAPAPAREKAKRKGARRDVPEDDLRDLEEQARALQQMAERSRQEAERMMEAIIHEMRRTQPEGPERVALPVPPEPPAPATPPVPPVAPAPPPPPPPWSVWFPASDSMEDVAPESVLDEVRGAVTAVLERQRAPRAVRSDEFVSVAIDFLPGGFWVGGGLRPTKTVLIRVRRKEMDERQAGRLETGEFRKRVEYQEY